MVNIYKGIAIALLTTNTCLGWGWTFTGGPVNDIGKNPVLLPAIKTTHQNILNQFNAIQASSAQKVAILTAISELIGAPTPGNLNKSLSFEVNPEAREIGEQLEAEFEENPDDFVIHDSLQKSRAMNTRLHIYDTKLQEIINRGNAPMTISQRQGIKAELGMLENQIRIDGIDHSAELNKNMLMFSNEDIVIERQLIRDADVDKLLR